jgi:hypothetical protein
MGWKLKSLLSDRRNGTRTKEHNSLAPPSGERVQGEGI